MTLEFRRIKTFLAKRSWLVGLILGFGVGLFLTISFMVNVSFLATWQQSLSDLLFLKQKPSEQIIIVAVDEKSLARIGRWPWPRSVHTRLIDIVAGHGAKAIGMDISFSETSIAGEDKALADSLSRANKVILPALFDLKGTQVRYEVAEAKSIESPARIFSKAARDIGHVNVYPDADSVVRSLPLVIELKGRRYLALSLLLLGQAESSFQVVSQLQETRTVKLRSREIPLEPGAKMRINFAGPGGTLRTVSYTDVLVGKVDPVIFKDKIVLVGITAKALGDRYMTPTSEGTPISGVEVHANAVDTILKGDFLVEQTPLATVLLILVLSSLSGLAFSRLRALWSGLIALGLVGLTIILAVVRFEQGVIANIVYPPLAVFGTYMAVITYRFVFEGMEKRRVQGLFGRYVKPEVVQKIIQTADQDIVKLEGYSQLVTVLFADIRGFTRMSEKLQPQEVVSVLNKYLDFMTETIFKHDGTLDKYIGDAIMAFFNAPHEQPDHALRAVKAAWDMQCRVKEFQKSGELGKLPSVCYGIGINTGEAVVGNIGSTKRHDYTIIGDSVNLASRLCGAAEAGHVLISQSTYDLVKDHVKVEKLPPMQVKGKAKPIAVYNVKEVF